MRRRHLGRSRGPRRKLHWETGSFWSTPDFELGNAKTVYSWAKWPSATVDDSQTVVDFDYVTPKDETLVRSSLSGYCYVEAPSLEARSFIGAVGLIAWDSVNPNIDYENVILDAGLGPSPISDGSLDWVHRFVVAGRIAGAVGFSTDLVITTMDVADGQRSSRAQRKLPSGTGLLMAFEVQEAFGDLADINTLQFWWEYRMLFKDP